MKLQNPKRHLRYLKPYLAEYAKEGLSLLNSPRGPWGNVKQTLKFMNKLLDYIPEEFWLELFLINELSERTTLLEDYRMYEELYYIIKFNGFTLDLFIDENGFNANLKHRSDGHTAWVYRISLRDKWEDLDIGGS